MELLSWAKSYGDANAGIAEGRMFIGGEWKEAENGATFHSTNPATGERLITIPSGSRADAAEAAVAAAAAFPRWAGRLGAERAAVLEQLAAELTVNTENLARLITLEEGKPLAQARWEVGYSSQYLRWYAGEAARIEAYCPASTTAGRTHQVSYRPVGVVVAVTPWNLPCAMVVRKIAAALAAGCTVAVKPAEQTPGTALALAELAQQAGVPAGVLNVVTGDPPVVVGELLRHPAVRMLTFTGSREVGKRLMGQAAERALRVCLQMGGHAPFIVFEDADLDMVSEALVVNKFRNSGQSCLSTNRLYVHEAVQAALEERLVQRVEKLRIGNGLLAEVDLGPVIDEAAVEKIQQHVDDALEHGARLLCGGERISPERDSGGDREDSKSAHNSTFYAPTILSDVGSQMRVCREETFGPVLPIMAFADGEQLIADANASSYGLAAYVYTRDLRRGRRVAEALEYGAIGLNDPVPTLPQAPFGGLKESGIGREGGREGLMEFLETKLLSAREL